MFCYIWAESVSYFYSALYFTEFQLINYRLKVIVFNPIHKYDNGVQFGDFTKANNQVK